MTRQQEFPTAQVPTPAPGTAARVKRLVLLTLRANKAVAATDYSVGPVSINEAESTITLAPGVYTVTVPVTLEWGPKSVVSGVHYAEPNRDH